MIMHCECYIERDSDMASGGIEARSLQHPSLLFMTIHCENRYAVQGSPGRASIVRCPFQPFSVSNRIRTPVTCGTCRDYLDAVFGNPL